MSEDREIPPAVNSALPSSPAIPAEQQLSVTEKVGYGLGDTASNLYWKLFEYFQLYFYTNVFGLDPDKAGTMFFVTKIWDAINDPLIGSLADRTRTAWGRFRPWLIWMIVPFMVTGILTFYTPDLPPSQKLVYAYVTYTLVFMAYTAINIPYGALLGVISSNSKERTLVSTFRFVLAFFGGLIVQKFTEPLVAFFGGGYQTSLVDGVTRVASRDLSNVVDPQTGFFWTVVVYACLAAILFVLCFLFTRERVQPQQVRNTAIHRDMLDLIANRPWIVLMLVGLFQILAGWTRGSATAFYFTYYVGSTFGNFLVVGTVASILGMLMTSYLTDIFGKKWLMIIMNLAQAILTAVYIVLRPEQTLLIYGIHILSSFIVGPVPVLLWAMYADVADYSEWKNHQRATGLVFAAATFSQKLGGALGGAIPGWLLAWYGFRSPIENQNQPQTDSAIFGILLMMSVIPAVFLALAATCMAFYNISESLLVKIETDLEQRKQALPSQESRVD